MATMRCARRQPNRGSSGRHWPSRLRNKPPHDRQPEFRGQACAASRAIKDSCQLVRVFAFAVEGPANGGEGLGERKNLAPDKQVGILCSDWVPVNTLSSDGDFGY